MTSSRGGSGLVTSTCTGTLRRGSRNASESSSTGARKRSRTRLSRVPWNPMAANDPEVSQPQCDCRRVEQVLLGHPSIADCAVLERTTAEGQSELLAYIVPASAFAAEELFASLETTALPRPAQFVPGSSIPLSP